MRINFLKCIFNHSRFGLFALIGLFFSSISLSAEVTNENNKNAQLASIDYYNLSLAELSKVQVSIATGNATRLEKAPSTASVIYAAQIEAMGAATLDDALELIPGLHVSVTGWNRLDAHYSVRGMFTGYNPQILVMMNGVPLRMSMLGTRPPLFRLPVNCIERIEVIRGSGSAVYGADAYAGVINVITKDVASIDKTRITLHRGSFNQSELGLQTATEWKGFGISLTSSWLKSDGDSSRRVSADLQTTLDSIFNTKASLAPGKLSTGFNVVDTHLAVSNEKLQLNIWHWMEVNAGMGAGAAQALDPRGRYDANLLEADLTYHFYKNEFWDHSFTLSGIRNHEINQYHIFPPGAVLPIGADGNINFSSPVGVTLFSDGYIGNPAGVVYNATASFTSEFSGFERHRIRFSLGSNYWSVDTQETKNFGPGLLDKAPLPSTVSGDLTEMRDTPYIFAQDNSRFAQFALVQDEWQLSNDINFTAGLRYDHYDDIGSTTNPRLALVWSVNEKLIAKFMLGSAYREPSMAELYFKNNPVALGNSHVKPETIDTQEISFDYHPWESLQTIVTFFDYQARGMIDFIPDANATTETAQNKNSHNAKGLELEINWHPSSHLQISTSYSLQESVDLATHETLPFAPQKQIKSNINWQFAQDYSLSTQVYWIADRVRATSDKRAQIPDYTRWNLTLTKKNIIPNADVLLSVRNLTDARILEPSDGTIKDDFPMESRSLWLGVNLNF